MTGVLRKLLGGKTERQWRKELILSRVFNKENKLVLKDPFLCMSHDYFSTLDFVKIIQIVRHPAAVWCSIKNMGWVLNLNNFGSVNYKFIGNMKFTDKENDEKSEVEKFSIIWREIYSRVFIDESSISGSVKLVRHEDICLEPVLIFDSIFKFLDIEFSSEARRFLLENTDAETVEKESGVLHEIRRNSAELVNSWRSKINSRDEEVIKSYCGVLVDKIYGGW